MLVRFRRGLDDDNAFINLISPCRTMDCILRVSSATIIRNVL